MTNMETLKEIVDPTGSQNKESKSRKRNNEMKKSNATKNRVARHLALSLLAGAALVVAISNAPAESAHGRSSASPNLAKVAAVNFQEPSRSGANILPVPQALTYVAGLLLAAFLVHAHARAVLKKHARM